MNFMHPWALGIGAAAVALPIAIHWLTKPRPVRLPLSTIRFVRSAIHQRRARYRLRDWIILLLRAAAVALLAWAFARPLIDTKPLISPLSAGDTLRVVVLDVSQSTAAVTGGVRGLERGRTVAADYLQYQPGLKASLILAAAKPTPAFAQASPNVAALRDALATAAPKPERLDVQAAINKAAEVLASVDNSNGLKLELIVISDFQRSNWATADFAPLPQETKIQFESFAPPQTPGNFGIVRVGVTGRLEQDREARLEVDVANYSKTPRDVQVELTLGDVPYRLAGSCPPGSKSTLATQVPLSAAGWLAGQAKLVGMNDALSADDVRSFVLDVRAAPTYALITRDASRPHASSSHFLERALVPNLPRDGGDQTARSQERVVRLDPDHLDLDALATSAVVVIDHPGALSNETINALAGLMRRGRGLLYVAAEPADATNLKRLTDAAGSDMKMPVKFAPLPPASGDRRDLFLVDWKKDQPPFANLGENAAALLSPVRFAGGLSSRRIEGGLIDDILATFSDRSAALIVTPCGAGTLAVLNVDLGRSSLVGSPAFVPVIGELVGRLLATRGGGDAAACGELLSAYLPPEAGKAEGLQVSALTSDESTPAPESMGMFLDSGSMVLWRWNEAAAPGIYTVKRGSEVVFAAATAVPAVESELETIDPAILQTRLAGGRNVHFQTAGQLPPKDDRWAWALTACAVCMIGEVALLKGFKT